MTMAPRAWWGRVFGRGDTGGNHTVIVSADGPEITDPADLARRFGVPDTGFVTTDRDEVRLRTFSPVEELGECLQTSLAAVTALDRPEGTTLRVGHRTTKTLSVHREGPLTWARYAEPAPLAVEGTTWPDFIDPEPAAESSPVVVRGARSRGYLRCADVDALVAARVSDAAVLDWCRRNRCSGLVLTAATHGGERVRVYTTSLRGQEDRATGGAVLTWGALLADAGARGELEVLQGPAETDRQGHLRLRLLADGNVVLGGEVRTLISGTVAAC